MTPKLLYILHSGQMFGTERMALATLQALGIEDESMLLAPPGPVHAAAHARGVHSIPLTGRAALTWALVQTLWRHRDVAVVATGVLQSLLVCALQRLLGGRGAHLHVVHGGTDERLSYGRKRLLAGLPLRLVAVSDFVRQRLIAHGVPAERIEVIGNFLPAAPTALRPPFAGDGVRRVVLLSRLDPIKRVALLFDALERTPGLSLLHFDIYGTGAEAEKLEERARQHPNVRLHGFVPEAAAALAEADLLLHTCPEEPFGLVLLEAFAAGVPVLVPNSGGAGDIVQHGVNGWHFSANDAVALGQRLQMLTVAPSWQLEAMATRGREVLQRRHAPTSQAQHYAKLLQLTGANA